MKYAVVWQDKINFGIVEISSTRKKALSVARLASFVTPTSCEVVTIEDALLTIEYLIESGDSEAWHHSKDEISNAVIDYYFDRMYKSIKKKSTIPSISQQTKEVK